MSQEEKAKMVLDDLADRLPEMFDMEDIRSRVDEVTPYVMVAIQVGTRPAPVHSSVDTLSPRPMFHWSKVHDLCWWSNVRC